MASLRDIRRRINSVRSTQKITRAMKMVAAAKLRRAQETILRTRPYALSMRDLVNRVAMRAAGSNHPLLQGRANGKVLLLVVTSDRGLCGSFNSSLVNEALRLINGQFKDKDASLVVIGRKGIEAFRRRNLPIRTTYTNVMDGDILRMAETIISGLIKDYMTGDVDAVYCLYNEFKSAIAQRVTLERLLPFEPEESDAVVSDYLYEPSQESLLETLLARDLQVQMHRILHESAASEFGARMTAMESATSNAGDMIDRLTLQYNRVRQDAITKEMIEIIGGAEAL